MTVDTQKLRDFADSLDANKTPLRVLVAIHAAADHIDAQAAEIARLRGALDGMVSNFEPRAWGSNENKSDALENARAALSGESNG